MAGHFWCVWGQKCGRNRDTWRKNKGREGDDWWLAKNYNTTILIFVSSSLLFFTQIITLFHFSLSLFSTLLLLLFYFYSPISYQIISMTVYSIGLSFVYDCGWYVLSRCYYFLRVRLSFVLKFWWICASDLWVLKTNIFSP